MLQGPRGLTFPGNVGITLSSPGCYLFCLQPPFQVLLSRLCVIPVTQMSLFCYQWIDGPLSSISHCKAVLIERRNVAGLRDAHRVGSLPGSQAVSGSQFPPSPAGPVLACGSPLVPMPHSTPPAADRQPCSGSPTPKPGFSWTYSGKQVLLFPKAESGSDKSVPSRESQGGSRPLPSTGCPVGIPELLPSTTLGNALKAQQTPLHIPTWSSVE